MALQQQQRAKIGLVGAGQIGGNLALMAAQRHLGDVVMYDIVPGIAKGKALDLSQLAATAGYPSQIVGTEDIADLAGSDVVIITAGLPRKPGMSRDDLLDTNVKIMADVSQKIGKHCPNAFVIVISNPLDAMVFTFAKLSGLPKQRIVGMAGVLDSSRFRFFIAEQLKVAIEDVVAFVLGGHGDDMVPIVSFCSVAGIPLTHWMDGATIEQLVQRTRQGGGEIVQLLKQGSAFYAPAGSAIIMAQSYLRDEKRVLPAAAYCSGQYKVNGLFVGVPVIIGGQGIERIVEAPITAQEQTQLTTSAAHVAELVKEAEKRLG